MIKRIKVLLLIFIVLTLVIIAKLTYIQSLRSESYLEAAASQRALNEHIDFTRGNIYDRNNIPLTKADNKVCFIIMPNLVSNIDSVLNNLEEICEFDKKYQKTLFIQGKNIILNSKISAKIKIEEMKELQDMGVLCLWLNYRYGNNSLARHIIGYINEVENRGISGIEKIFDKELDGEEISLNMISNAKKQPIVGLGYRVSNYGLKNDFSNVKLTLDYHIQNIVENIMNKNVESGAVIVSDCISGDILACASRPNFKQSNIEEYINMDGSNLINKAYSNYNVGSVFKIIVAAAALENKIVSAQSLFNCTGVIDVEGKEFNCSGGTAHGEIDFKQAFAKSCNTTFIDIGLKTGQKGIIEMAERFGFGEKTGVLDGIGESNGNLPDKTFYSLRENANIAIGQGEVLATPIQILNMVNIIANNGIKVKLNLVDSIVNDSGKILKKIKKIESHRVINSDIARNIKDMMYEVTVSGTGTNANLGAHGGACGKTGSAETGWIEDGDKMVHAWFTGFFPYNDPQYSIVVFVENGRWGSTAAAPLFKSISEEIIKLDPNI